MKEFFNQLAVYLFLKKRDTTQPHSFNFKMMHGMNRISLIMALLAFILVAYRLIKLYV